MKETKNIELVPWPSLEISENFEFDAIASTGTFTFHFKWLNDKWNLWVTLPDGQVRQASTYPGVLSWSGFNDYGLILKTNLERIDYNSLLLAEIYLVVWQ